MEVEEGTEGKLFGEKGFRNLALQVTRVQHTHCLPYLCVYLYIFRRHEPMHPHSTAGFLSWNDPPRNPPFLGSDGCPGAVASENWGVRMGNWPSEHPKAPRGKEGRWF